MPSCYGECLQCAAVEAHYEGLIAEVFPDAGPAALRFGLVTIADALAHGEDAVRRGLLRATTANLQGEREYRQRELSRIETLSAEGRAERAALVQVHEARLQLVAEELTRRSAYHVERLAPALWDGEFAQSLKRRIDLPTFAAQQFGAVLDGRRDPAFTLCPWHQEDTPSLAIWPDHGYCFGCAKAVDVYDWILHAGQARSFPEAVRWLAAMLGQSLPNPVLPVVREAPRPRVETPLWERAV